MSQRIRLEPSGGGDGRRFAVGVRVASNCRELSAALVGAEGRGLAMRIAVVAAHDAPVPAETARLSHDAASADSIGTAALALLRAELAEHQAAATVELLAAAGVAPGRILAVGVHDPGVWSSGTGPPGGYAGLCDPARLAEATGINVIDAFPARDVACGGQGGPILALAEWLLLGDARRTRVLLDLGRTTRATYLPAATRDRAAPPLLAFDVGPGTALLDELARRLTGGAEAFDAGGKLAAQGRRIPELIDHWTADPYFDRPLPRWHPRGVRPERFLAEALRMALEAGWSVRDILCSATHLIAESVAAAIRKRLPGRPPVEEILVTGGGRHNGMLLRNVARETGLPLARVEELGLPGAALGPAAVAVMALLYLDQVPGNPSGVTGADVPRLLGRLTPGSPQSWQRLLESLTGVTPPARVLRAAV